MSKPDRIDFVAWAGLAAALVLMARLFQIQILSPERYKQDAVAQYTSTRVLPARRGNIYDRGMNAVAQTVSARQVGVNLSEVQSTSNLADHLARFKFGNRSELRKLLRTDRDYLTVYPDLMGERLVALDTLSLAGLDLKRTFGRSYPFGPMFAHVVGSSGRDGHGLEGLEMSQDSLLAGTPGWIELQRIATGGVAVAVGREHPRRGNDVVLTLDETVQRAAHHAVLAGVERHEARAGSVVVLDPTTGQIWAICNAPDYEPGRVAESQDSTRRNRAVTDLLEPGSVFKIVTFAAAIEHGLFADDDTLNCGRGSTLIGRHRIRDVHKYDRLRFDEVLINSSNVGTIRVAEALGKDRLYAAARAFGFGQRTGVDLPGEVAGLLNPPRAWSNLSLPCLSIGQEVSATALQLACAMGAIAADGDLMEPHAVDRVLSPEGWIMESSRQRRIRQVISPETAERLESILIRSVDEGTGSQARIEGARIAGKTGTAQRAGRAGSYQAGNYNSNFVGYLVDREPPLVIAVSIIEPKKGFYGGEVAAPVFREVAQAVLGEDAIRGPRLVRSPSGPMVVMPSLRGLAVQEARREAVDAGFSVEVEGGGEWVTHQNPEPGSPLVAGASVILFSSATNAGAVSMPALKGLSTREAYRLLTGLGLQVRLEGSGRIVRQVPPAGVAVSPQSRCVVRAEPPGGAT